MNIYIDFQAQFCHTNFASLAEVMFGQADRIRLTPASFHLTLDTTSPTFVVVSIYLGDIPPMVVDLCPGI